MKDTISPKKERGEGGLRGGKTRIERRGKVMDEGKTGKKEKKNDYNHGHVTSPTITQIISFSQIAVK